MTITKVFDFKSNEESNLFLRCLWSRLRINFGKLGWLLMPCYDTKNSHIILDNMDIGLNHNVSISIRYKNKSILSQLTLEIEGTMIPELAPNVEQKINKSLEEAIKYEDHTINKTFTYTFDSSIQFNNYYRSNFTINNNNFSFNIRGFDDNDLRAFATKLTRNIKNLLSFDTLLIIDDKSDSTIKTSIGSLNKIKLSDRILNYIEKVIDRDVNYLNSKNRFEKAVSLFVQGMIFESMSYNTEVSKMINTTEQSIVLYMSSLEIISINDIKPSRCKYCNMEKYSISKRVKQLVEKAISNNYSKKIDYYYKLRSKYLHSGEFISSNNYTGASIPLLGERSLISQIKIINPLTKEDIKQCIIFHEENIYGELNADTNI